MNFAEKNIENFPKVMLPLKTYWFFCHYVFDIFLFSFNIKDFILKKEIGNVSIKNNEVIKLRL